MAYNDWLQCPGLYNIKGMVLKGTFWVVLESELDAARDLPASRRRNIPTLFWILSGILALGSRSSPVHEETST